MITGEESVRYRAARPVKGIPVIVVCLGEVYLYVGIVTCHFMEIQWGDVAPDFQGIVHEGSDSVVAQLRFFGEGTDSGSGNRNKRHGYKQSGSAGLLQLCCSADHFPIERPYHGLISFSLSKSRRLFYR